MNNSLYNYTMEDVQFSPQFIRRIHNTFGRAGILWLENLPVLLEEVSNAWEIKVSAPLESLSYNYLTSVEALEGVEMVLKAGVPNPELESEIKALRFYNGRGAVRLLRADTEKGVLLLERLNPGNPLFSVDNDEIATHIAGQVMKRLHIPYSSEGSFSTTTEWFQRGFSKLRARFDGGTGPFPKSLVEQVEGTLAELLTSISDPVLLHGDLHHWNILASDREPWLAIDPKGVIGEEAYECGAWLRNQWPGIQQNPDRKEIILGRARQFSSEWGFDYQRVLSWGYVQAFLSAWWSFEDNDQEWRRALDFAEDFPGVN